MIDIETLGVMGLLDYVRKTRDSTTLIKWIRDGKKITPELSLLIADILEGKLPAKPKPLSRMKILTRGKAGISILKSVIEHYKELLGSNDLCVYNELKAELNGAGYKAEYPETKGDISDAAKLLTANLYRLTPAQLDELIHPRKSREK